MKSSWIGGRQDAGIEERPYPSFEQVADESSLGSAIHRTTSYLIQQQTPQGYWVGELEGDTILESEYLLLLAYLGREQSETAGRLARYLLEKQNADGGWSIYPGGPLEISASVKAYFALKLTGHDPHGEPMKRARRAIRAAGGAEATNSFTRFYLALLGQVSYDCCPAVPPEMILLPKWCPFNIYAMSSWTRTIVVPLSILWAHRPVRRLPRERGIGELFLRSPSRLGGPQPPPHSHDTPWKPTQRCLTWDRLFLAIDATLKQFERLRLRPLRRRALRAAEQWMLERSRESDGLGAIFPPIVWSVVALGCLDYAEDSPEVTAALEALERLYLDDEARKSTRLQPCHSPVWDTALSMLALSEAGVTSDELPLVRGVDWLLSKEVRRRGDWSVRNPETEPGGWFFEFDNAFYPDVDDTAMVLMALDRATPGEAIPSLNGNGSTNGKHDGNGRLLRHINGSAPELAAVWMGQAAGLIDALPKVEKLHRAVAAKDRALGWLLSMQNRDGGWPAFDRDNDCEVLTRVPFADHNAMIDPSSCDLTGRALEMLGMFGFRQGHAAVDAGVQYLLERQERDGTWIGRWGVNYIYGTWQAIVGLVAIGFEKDDPVIAPAVRWLAGVQQPCGGWGESPRSYDDPDWKGRGEPTASQTAWALLGLLAAGGDQPTIDRGVRYLLETQKADGTWDEQPFTGTGFPRVFYLKYHLYRIYFPLMALARYRRARQADLAGRELASSQAARLLSSR